MVMTTRRFFLDSTGREKNTCLSAQSNRINTVLKVATTTLYPSTMPSKKVIGCNVELYQPPAGGFSGFVPILFFLRVCFAGLLPVIALSTAAFMLACVEQ